MSLRIFPAVIALAVVLIQFPASAADDAVSLFKQQSRAARQAEIANRGLVGTGVIDDSTWFASNRTPTFTVEDGAGRTHVVVIESVEDHGGGSRTIIGKVQRSDENAETQPPTNARVIITMAESGAFGTIALPDRTLSLRPAQKVQSSQPLTMLFDSKLSGDVLFQGENDELVLPPPATVARQTAAGDESPSEPAAIAAAPDGLAVIDILLLYTPGMVAAHGANLDGRLNYLVAIANLAFLDSEVAMKLRVVGRQLITYPDTFSNATALGAIIPGTPQSDPTLAPAIANLRNATGADLVALIRPFNASAQLNCGMATVGGAGQTNIALYAEMAYSVSSDGRDGSTAKVCDDATFAHEIGHNMGLKHDRITVFNQEGTITFGAYPYSFGYGVINKFYTIMGYPTPYGSAFNSRMYSNPAISHPNCTNLPCGASESDPFNAANAALSLNNVRFAVAAFRASAIPDLNVDPFHLPRKNAVTVNSMVTSDPVTIRGAFTGTVPISVVAGEYSIGCTETYTRAPGQVSSGQVVCVRHRAAPTVNSGISTMLTVGNASSAFTSFTDAILPMIGVASVPFPRSACNSSDPTSRRVQFGGHGLGTAQLVFITPGNVPLEPMDPASHPAVFPLGDLSILCVPVQGRPGMWRIAVEGNPAAFRDVAFEPEPVRRISPREGEAVYPRPTMSWEPVTGATSYVLTLYSPGGSLINTNFSTTVNQTSFTFTSDIQGGVWQVRACHNGHFGNVCRSSSVTSNTYGDFNPVWNYVVPVINAAPECGGIAGTNPNIVFGGFLRYPSVCEGSTSTPESVWKFTYDRDVDAKVTITGTTAGSISRSGVTGIGSTGTGGSVSFKGRGPYTATITGTSVTTGYSIRFESVLSPDPPENLRLEALNGAVRVFFDPPPFTGAGAITGYSAACGTSFFNQDIRVSGSASPIVVTGLANGRGYFCTASAHNAVGRGADTNPRQIWPTAFTLLSVKSRKTHGASGALDVPLVFNPQTGIHAGVEPRASVGPLELVYTFNGPVTQMAWAEIYNQFGTQISSANISQRVVGNDVIVTLNHPGDRRHRAIRMTGVNGVVNTSMEIDFLVGDVDADGAVSVEDCAAVLARSGQAADGSNARFDIDASGIIDAADVHALNICPAAGP